MTNSNIPISLYIHTPWCIHKCPYCDFNSHAVKGTLPESRYIDALIEDFESQQANLAGRSIKTIFIGGGTPSLFSANSYKKLLNTLRSLAPIDSDAEITLEANPGTVEQARFQGYHQAGINRLSIGIQSFDDHQLKTLQRIHTAAEAIKSVNIAKKSGFDNFNLDLMFGLPNQSTNEGLKDLETAITLNPSHLSWYQLTIEPNTFFHYQPPLLPDDDDIWMLQQQGQALLSANGYQQYEISAYSQPQKQCRHNLNYWLFGDYIGIGAGAHGKLTDVNTQTIQRRWNHKNPRDYLNPSQPFLAGQKHVDKKERALEFMMNALRLYQPMPLSLFEENTFLSRSEIERPLDQAIREKYLNIDQDTLILTQKGHNYLNSLLNLF
jgi:putative oxygen-independent coproporphyrinogen III oxidase